MVRTSDGYVETKSLTWLHWVAVLLVLTTGVVHVYAGAVEGRLPVSLAGVGFVVAAALFLVDYRRPLLYAAGIVYTAVQLPLWYVAKAGEYSAIGLVDKTIQVVLIGLLAYLYWRQRGPSGSGADATSARGTD